MLAALEKQPHTITPSGDCHYAPRAGQGKRIFRVGENAEGEFDHGGTEDTEAAASG